MRDYSDFSKFDKMMSSLDNQPKEEIYVEQNRERKRRKKRRKKGRVKLLYAIIILILLYFVLSAINHFSFDITNITFESEKITAPVKLAVLADLHGWQFGENNERLVEAINKAAPDLILIVGDMLNQYDTNADSTINLCKQLVKIAPVFYSFGNHENVFAYGTHLSGDFLTAFWAAQGYPDGYLYYENIPESRFPLIEALTEINVHVLNNSYDTIECNGQNIDLIGLNVLSGDFRPFAKGVFRDFTNYYEDHFKLVLSHWPDTFADGIGNLSHANYDLGFCGHAHGGLIRIPGLGGVFRKGTLLPVFTGYDSGMYSTGNGQFIVSRGLGNSSAFPRINNQPELLIVNLQSEKK